MRHWLEVTDTTGNEKTAIFADAVSSVRKRGNGSLIVVGGVGLLFLAVSYETALKALGMERGEGFSEVPKGKP